MISSTENMPKRKRPTNFKKKSLVGVMYELRKNKGINVQWKTEKRLNKVNSVTQLISNALQAQDADDFYTNYYVHMNVDKDVALLLKLAMNNLSTVYEKTKHLWKGCSACTNKRPLREAALVARLKENIQRKNRDGLDSSYSVTSPEDCRLLDSDYVP